MKATELKTPASDIWQRFELQEAAYWSDYYRNASSETIERCGIHVSTIGSAQISIAANIDILGFNRVIGLGIDEPATKQQLEDITAEFESAGVPRFFTQLSPYAAPKDLPEWLEERGFQYYNNWVKLYRSIEPLPLIDSKLHVEQIDEKYAGTFADIIIRSFEWPEAVQSLVASTVGKPGWKHYLAFDKDQPIACAAAYIDGEYASLAFAATLPEYRGRGAQSALISRRIHDCAAQGCKWLLVETAEEKPDKPVASYRNMLRFGFEVAYIRSNYIYRQC